MQDRGTRLALMTIVALLLTAGVYWWMDRTAVVEIPDPADQYAGSETTEAGDSSTASRAPDPALAAIDEAIAAAEARAAARDDDWLHLEIASNRYLDRARASGDWQDFAKAEDALRRAFERAPEGTGPHLARAAFEYAMHRLAAASAALDVFNAQAYIRPDHRPIAAQLRADIAFHSGRYDDAKAQYEAILEDGRTAEVLIALAQYHWKTGDYPAAEALLEEAGADSANRSAAMRAWVSLVRGLFGLERGDYDEALAHYRSGLTSTPDSWLLEEHIAEILTLRGEASLAIPIYERVVARTGNPELMDALAELLRERNEPGDEERAEALIEGAAEAWEARLALFPEAAYGHAIGHYLDVVEDFDRAVTLAERNAEARPNGESKTTLASAYLAAERLDDAQATIDEVLESPWNTAEAHAVASAIYEATGDTTRAGAERTAALALNPHVMDE